MPGPVSIMEKEREVVCGADIHKHFLLATILTKGGQKFQDRFDSNFEGLLSFRQWLLGHGCQRLAVESTANYWQPIYFVLGKDVEFGSSLNQVGRLNCNFPSLRYIISMRFFVVLKPLALLFAD